MSGLKQQIQSGSKIVSGVKPVERITIGLPGSPSQLIVYQGKIYTYNSEGQTLIDGGFIATRAIAAKAVTTGKLFTASRKFVHNITWTATDENTGSWSSSVLKLADGTTFSINAGNTRNLSEKNYIYFNGSSTLQKTKYYNSAIGGNNIPLAIINPVSIGKCVITPFVSIGTTINGDLIITGKIQSTDGKTYFDLDNDVFVINESGQNRILIGKIGIDYGIKVSLPGYNALTEIDIDKFALIALSSDTVDSILIKEKTRGSINVTTGNSETITHGLSYVPFCLVFVEEEAGKFIKCYGESIDGRGFRYIINDTNLIMYNSSGTNRIFKYYIFYDQVAS